MIEFPLHLKRVILLAWARSLGADQHEVLNALDQGQASLLGEPVRFPIPTDDVPGADPGIATVVRLFSVTFVYGPQWFIDATPDLDDEVLSLESTMLKIGSGSAGGGMVRSMGETALYYMDEPPVTEPSDQVAVSEQLSDVLRLEAECPNDDVVSASVSKSGRVFALVADGSVPEGDTPPVVAAAGIEEWETLIGDITVLVHPELRRSGLGSYVASVAAQEAHADGLVPQWRLPFGNKSAQHTADSIGFVLAGSQTTLQLPPTPTA